MRPVTVGLLDAQRVERMIATMPEAKWLAGFHYGVVDADRKWHGHIQLPAQFADVGDADGECLLGANLHLARCREGKSIVRPIAARNGREQLTGARTLNVQHAPGVTDVSDDAVPVRSDVLAQPRDHMCRGKGRGT